MKKKSDNLPLGSLVSTLFTKLDWTRVSSDLITALLALAESQKQVVLDKLAQEFRDFLQRVDFAREVERVLSDLDIKMTIHLDVTPKNKILSPKKTVKKRKIL